MKLGIIDNDYMNSFKKAKEFDLDFVEFCVNVDFEKLYSAVHVIILFRQQKRT